MLSARFSELAQKPDAPFLAAGAGRSLFLARTKEQASLSARVKEDGIERGLEGLLGEAERVARFGFTATELERQKQSVLRSYERVVAEVDNIVSSSRANEYVRNFTQNETLPSPNDEYAMHQRFLPQITLDEVNKLSKEWFGTDRNRIVVVTAPEKADVPLPTSTQLTAVLKAAPSKTLTAYVDSAGSASLMDSIPKGGTVVKATTREPGITEWELSNGVKVVLKPTNLKADEILFQAISDGGTSLASDADYIPASSAVNLVTAGGLGKFNLVDLRKTLTGKVASARPFISEIQEGVSGGASRKDLETMFQLIYLTFTAPRLDRDAFTVQATQAKTILANQAADPEFAFSKALSEALYQNHVRRQPMTVETIAKWDLDKSFAFYKERFADASNFTFIFIGDFDLPLMKPFAEQYLAALPSSRRKEDWKDVGARYAKGIIEKTVEKGIEPKSEVALVLTGPFKWDQSERVAIRAMANVLQERLREAIREELGGTYSISASAGIQKLPRSEYTFSIQFGADPKRVGDLLKRVTQEIEKLKTEGPTSQEAANVKALFLREFETNSKQNSYLLGQLTGKYQFREDPAGVWLVPDYYNKIDVNQIHQAAKTYLDMKNRVQVTLMPEKK